MATRLSYLRLTELSARGRKARFFSPLTFEPKSELCHETSKLIINLYSIREL